MYMFQTYTWIATFATNRRSPLPGVRPSTLPVRERILLAPPTDGGWQQPRRAGYR